MYVLSIRNVCVGCGLGWGGCWLGFVCWCGGWVGGWVTFKRHNDV